MKRIICLALIILFSTVAIAKDKEIKMVAEAFPPVVVQTPNGLRVVYFTVHFDDAGVFARLEATDNVLIGTETVDCEQGNIEEVGFVLTPTELTALTALRVRIENAIIDYKGIIK